MAFVGLRDLYYAPLTKDDETGVTYGTPKKIAGAITAKVTPSTASGTLFGDDGPLEHATVLGDVQVELNTADLSTAIQADLLGHAIGANGVLLRKASDIPPYVAVGYRSLKANGKYRYVWLVKGKFQEPEQSHKTKGNDVNFETPTIQGAFIKREYDELWEKTIDSDDPGYTAAVGDNWFASVE